MRKTVLCGVFLLGALALGAGGASGRELATTTIQVQVIGGGDVAGGGGQISCGGELTDCFATYVSGSSVTITATGSSDWTFAGWDGCSSVSGASCVVTLGGSPAHNEITATFNPTGVPPGESTLTVSTTTDLSGKGGEVTGGQIDCGSINSDCTWTAVTDSTLTVIETPDTGYSFDGWGGACSGTDTSCTVTMSDDAFVTATFVKSAATNSLSVTVTGNGVVSGGGISCTSAGGSTCSADEAANTQVTLTATPGSGAGFSGWGGACAGTTTTCVVTMDGAKSVTASFSGGQGPPPPTGSTFSLVVSVTGNGAVSGGGIDCGDGATQCSKDVASGTIVVLTAIPSSGATFTGWGDACSGSTRTCTLSMTRARSVSATFTGGTSNGTTQLTVAVTGPGTVTGGGITCGHGAKACSVEEARGATVVLTATAAQGARFGRWGGACSGTVRTCNVTANGVTHITAVFEAVGTPTPPPTGGVVLRSTGRPIVKRTSSGFAVTLRFSASRRGEVHVRALRAGRIQAAFAFAIAAGRVTAGPFPLGAPGFYRFEVALAGGSLHWTACLGICGPEAAASPFTLARRAPTIARSGALWSLQIRFSSTQAAGIDLRVFRRGTLAREVRFPVDAGPVVAKPLLLSPGSYSLRLYAVDAYGRVRTLNWLAILG